MAAVQFPRGVAITGLTFSLLNKSTGAAITTGTVSGYVTKDNGTQAAIVANPTHKGNGQWAFNLTADERDAKITGVLFVHTDGVILNINVVSDDQLGPGGIEWDLDFGENANGAEFWITLQTSETVLASGFLDDNGQATVYLDAGSYYVYGQKVGYNFNNPNSLVVE